MIKVDVNFRRDFALFKTFTEFSIIWGCRDMIFFSSGCYIIIGLSVIFHIFKSKECFMFVFNVMTSYVTSRLCSRHCVSSRLVAGHFGLVCSFLALVCHSR